MKDRKRIIFFIIVFAFNMAASFAHPVTPTLIVERNLDSSMFGVALAAMMTMNFLFSPFWGQLCGYMPTRGVLMICGLGYAAGQVIFASAATEAAVIGGRMFAGVFTGGAFTAMSNYVLNTSSADPSRSTGENLIILTTLQNVGSACGYFVGGMLGVISVLAAFGAQIAVLAGCGILFRLFCVDDTPYKEKPEEPLSLRRANPFAAILSAGTFMTPMLAMLFAIVAVSAIGQNSYEQCFNYYIKDQFGMSSAYNGIFKAVIAVLTILLNATVAMYLQKKTDINRTFLYILAACALLTGLALVLPGKTAFIGIYIVYSSVMVLRLPLLQTLCARRSDLHTSNRVMGFYQSMNSLGGIFGALFAGLIYNSGAMRPFILAFAAYVISMGIGLVYRNRQAVEEAGK